MTDNITTGCHSCKLAAQRITQASVWHNSISSRILLAKSSQPDLVMRAQLESRFVNLHRSNHFAPLSRPASSSGQNQSPGNRNTQPRAATRRPQHGECHWCQKSSQADGVTYLAEDLISLLADEVAPFIEVLHPERAPLVELGAESPSDFDDRPEHLIVAVACKQDYASIELVQRAPDGPHIDGVVVRYSQYDLGGPVESADEIWGELVVRRSSV